MTNQTGDLPQSIKGLFQATTAYWQDHVQRSILFLDVLRERGNIYMEHMQSGKPPVLVFDYEIVVDARSFARPVNYALTRILPPEGYPETNPKLRPFVVVDPRAGHGPGIGGFKMNSEIGIALKQGHPCYFFTFFPMPEAHQTIEDVTNAEVRFLEKVLELHPESQKPFMIGNCQGGWALVLLASLMPDKTGPLLLAGSPLSYWAGVEGKNPMRYSGGLYGGTWMASMAGDIGNGHFDGAYLVNNFDSLNLPNTYWTKLYNVFAKVDTEPERFLGFERWWGGHYLMNKEEMEWITQNLFVGNHLTSGELTFNNGKTRLDMRNIRAPIVVFASWGDNITPPQQALNWILDLYDNDYEILLNEQTIVYCLHDKIGHLGIFVSGSVASKQTSELVNGLDLIDILPPGLYEVVIEDTRPDMPGIEYVDGRYLISFVPRKLDDLRKLDDGRQDEEAFKVVRRLAEINQGIYDALFSPLVRSMSNEFMAQALRSFNPARMERWMFSDFNPFMLSVKMMADQVRAKRTPVDEDNPLLQAEKRFSDTMVQALQTCQDARDAFVERLFKRIFESKRFAALLGLELSRDDEGKAAAESWKDAEYRRLKREALQHRYDSGTPLDAVVRALLFAVGMEGFDERKFNFLRERVRQANLKRIPTLEEFKVVAREQTFLLLLDLEKALKGLRVLLPDPHMRTLLRDLAHRMSSTGEKTERLQKRLAMLDEALAVSPEEKAGETKAAEKSGNGSKTSTTFDVKADSTENTVQQPVAAAQKTAAPKAAGKKTVTKKTTSP